MTTRRRKRRGHTSLAGWLAEKTGVTPAEAERRLLAAREACAAMPCPVCGAVGVHRCTS